MRLYKRQIWGSGKKEKYNKSLEGRILPTLEILTRNLKTLEMKE